MKLTINNFALGLLTSLAVLSTSCSEMLDLNPPKNQLTIDKVFADSASALAATVQVYSSLAGVYSNLNRQLNVYTDEYVSNASNLIDFYQNQVTPENTAISQVWNRFYSVIYQCNNVLEQTRNPINYSEAFGQQLRMEALFIRSFCFYYLSNMFGDVPLITSTDVNRNAKASRTKKESVTDQIIADLTRVKESLSPIYSGGGKARVNKWAAAALLVRAYYSIGQWENAERLADEVIGSTMYTPFAAPENAFKAESRETIFELWNANGFVPETSLVLTASTNPPVFLSTQLIESFSEEDLRRKQWVTEVIVTVNDEPVTHYLPYKYRNTTNVFEKPEYLVTLRCAEQFLIRAECRARRGEIDGAIADLNVIKSRAGLPALEQGAAAEDVLNEIATEWRREMFGEWGNRFFYLQQNGRMDDVLEAVKPNWRNGVSALLPIPQNEITYNHNLRQNEGY